LNKEPLGEEDVSFIIESTEKKERIDAEKWTLIAQDICPRCGGKIRETETYSPARSDEPPDTVYYRVGCLNCNFEITSESYSL